jgi:haloalkane dehalogenase
MAPVFKRSIKGAQALDHPTVAGAGHFIQEDAGAELGQIVAKFVLG